ncbi:hypothetical protein GCM10023176_36250 [Micromonospora coerulea]|uniref:Uncharacterized protein n=1 Tax=Micromonospora coerulea TaxID=47856 RepID=A0ABP8SRF5_9ACTN
MKCFKVLRDYRRVAHTLTDDASGIASLHNIILAGWPPARYRVTPSPRQTPPRFAGALAGGLSDAATLAYRFLFIEAAP